MSSQKRHPLHFGAKGAVFAFIASQREAFEVKRLCRLYRVSRAGFYAWLAREASARRREDRRLTKRIRSVFDQNRGAYGSPRVQRELANQGVRVSRRRVERLMRAAGLQARVVRVYRQHAKLHGHYAQHPNLLWRTRAERADRVWVGDVTYVRVGRAWRFLAMVMDQYSRRILGWSLAAVRTTALTRAALDYALRRRRPASGLIFHSDRGTEYLGAAFSTRLRALGIRQSTTRGGAPADNAHAESFFHSMKADALHGLPVADDQQLRHCIATYVRYYNHRRLHSALGYRSPVAYEQLAA
jgi:transposase InsO family protein